MLGRSLDELPPQTRRLLLVIDEMVAAECERQKIERADFRFSRRDVRGITGWGDTQLKMHLDRLEELEYLLVHRGGRGQSFVYELAFAQSDGGRPVLPGLIDVEALAGVATTKASRGQDDSSGRGQVGPRSAGCRSGERSAERQYTMRVPEDATSTNDGKHIYRGRRPMTETHVLRTMARPTASHGAAVK